VGTLTLHILKLPSGPAAVQLILLLLPQELTAGVYPKPEEFKLFATLASPTPTPKQPSGFGQREGLQVGTDVSENWTCVTCFSAGSITVAIYSIRILFGQYPLSLPVALVGRKLIGSR
jgi:hypothetical protein